MKRLSFLLLFLSFKVFAQFPQLTENTEVSLITIGPGDQLYDKFGHTAIRIQDTVAQFDIAFNYGVYDFDTPNFYTKFAQGKLNYMVIAQPFQPFLRVYENEERSVREQVLNLNYSEKRSLYIYLVKNVQPENREYLYDFFYDNCATKPRDVIKESLGETIQYANDFIEEPETFRELIQQHLHWNTWGSLGIDVALGAVIDQKATAWEYQFLPEYVSKSVETATLNRNGNPQPLIKKNIILNKGKERTPASNFFTSPFFIFLVLAIVIIWVTYRDYSTKKRSRFLDGTLFGVTGVIGILLALLWFATDHTATANNYNLLWAFPLNIVVLIGIAKLQPAPWIRKYVFFLLLMLVLLTVHWISGVQRFAPALFPLLIALAVRYGYVLSYLKNNQ